MNTTARRELFSPICIGTMRLKNRFVMPAMETCLGDSGGFVTDELISYYRWRARGGVGLIIFENTGVHPSGRVNGNMVCIHEDKYIDGFRRLCDSVHAEGAKIAIQLSHAGRQTLSDFTGAQPVAPSAIPCPILREEPRELTADEIKELVEAFASGALRAKKAGADAVEFHMAHGYLVCQFLSPYSNKRADAYGGSTEGRARFAREILQRTREMVGRDFPLLCRISAEEYVEGGLEIAEAKKIAALLEKNGADAIHVSACNYETAWRNMPAYYCQEGCFVSLASQIKKTVGVPVLAVGRIRRVQMAQEILSRGDADLICIGRPLIADPFLIRKLEEGQEDRVRVCLSCNRCIESVASGRIVCVVNPNVGKEDSCPIEPASKKKTVLIVGAGPAGMQAAIVAAQRGHDVTLVDSQDDLGGQMILAGAAPCKTPILEFKDYLKREIARLPVQVALKKEMGLQEILSRKPDVVIVATGSTHVFPEIPGINEVCPFSVKEAFTHLEKIGQRVVIVGGGPEGAELADFLHEKGKKVSIIEMRRILGFGLPPTVRILLEKRLKDKGIEMNFRTKVVGFAKDSIFAEDKKLGKRTITQFDSVVIAVHHKSNNALFGQLEGKIDQLYLVGDAKEPRLILEAVAEGDAVGREI